MGLRTLAYKINKNRKGHYFLIKSNSPPSAAQEMERLMTDIMRVLTIQLISMRKVINNDACKKKNDDYSTDSSDKLETELVN